MAPSMEPYFKKRPSLNIVKIWLHRWSHVLIKIWIDILQKNMAPSMEQYFYDILPRHIFVKIPKHNCNKIWLHRWSHVFTVLYLVIFIKKIWLHHFINNNNKNTVPVFEGDKIKSCFANKTRSRSNKNTFSNRN